MLNYDPCELQKPSISYKTIIIIGLYAGSAFTDVALPPLSSSAVFLQHYNFNVTIIKICKIYETSLMWSQDFIELVC